MSSKQIRCGAILSYLSIALNIIAGLIYTPWMIKQIGQGQYGLYTLSNSVITLFLIDFGLGAATARYVSKYHAEGDEEKVSNFLGVIYKLYLIIDTVIFLILFLVFFLLDSIYVNLTPQEMQRFKVVYIIAAIFSIFNFPFVTQNGILTAYEKFIPLKLADIIYRILLIGFTVIALLLDFGLYALVLVHAIVGFLVILYKFIVLKSSLSVKANWKYSDKSLYKEIFSFSIWVTVSTLAQRLIFNITPTVLGVTSGTTAIAVFGVIVTIEGYAYTITTAINGMFMLKISKAYAEEVDMEEDAGARLNSLFLNVGRFQYALNGLIIVGFAVVGRYFMDLWMGDGYAEAYAGILLVIIPGLFFNALQIANTALIVRKKVKLLAVVNVLAGITNIILSFVLSYFIGMIGSCISIFIAYMLRALIMNIITGKVLKFDLKQFAQKCYFRMGIAMIGALLLSWLVANYIPNISWMTLLCEGTVVFVIYLIMVYFFGITKDERHICVAMLKKKILRRNKQ